jgi:hypothetical protein
MLAHRELSRNKAAGGCRHLRSTVGLTVNLAVNYGLPSGPAPRAQLVGIWASKPRVLARVSVSLGLRWRRCTSTSHQIARLQLTPQREGLTDPSNW